MRTASCSSARSATWRRHARYPASALLVLVAVALPAGAAPAPPEAPRTRHVLFLNSYHPGYAWSDDLVRGVRNQVAKLPFPVELWVEYMDTRRFDGAEHEARLEARLRYRYTQRGLDAIVASDDAALAFLLARRNLFPRVPVVFCGVNSAELAERAPSAQFTGIQEVFRIADVVELARQLRPGTRRFVVVRDATETAGIAAAAYMELAAKRPDLEFTILDGSVSTLDDVLAQLRDVPSDAAVLTTSFSIDGRGRYYPRTEALVQIAEASRAPIYSTAVSELGQGILAGAENRGLSHGQRAGAMVAALLEGASPAEIPRQSQSEARFIIDYSQLARWQIDERLVPPGAVVVSRPPSFYEDHKIAIWSVSGFILLQAVVIGALVLNVSRRRQAERRLAEQARSLVDSNRNLERLNTSLVREMDERRHAEERLRQAQRMEAIGQLAGGVAHDFNNLLTVIGSYADLVLEQLPDPTVQRQVEQIRSASQRAADLTRQLLAFSRKQLLHPTAVDLNAVVAGLEPMLRRLISENVTLTTRLSLAPATALVDRGQMEQVIVNLVVNARDAMPGGGQLEIATEVVDLTPDPSGARAGMPAGRYVQLRVSDTGSGMDDETRARAFEPFFTTKDIGRGTGLGLSTVYGIVKQSGGWVWLESGAGSGTTCTVHLPLAREATSDQNVGAEEAVRRVTGADGRPERAAGNRRTVLVVEDERDVRTLITGILRNAGYDVVGTASGEEAVGESARRQGAVDLLVTDIVLSGISGRETAERLRAVTPALRVLYVSGHSDEILAHGGVLLAGTAFLSKPFTPDRLTTAVRALLDEGGSLDGTGTGTGTGARPC